MRIAVEEPVYATPVVSVPVSVLFSQTLSPAARVIYAAVIYYGKDGLPSLTVLDDITRLSRDDCIEALKELEVEQLLKVERDGATRGKFIRLLALPDRYRPSAVVPLGAFSLISPASWTKKMQAVLGIWRREYQERCGAEYVVSDRRDRDAIITLLKGAGGEVDEAEKIVKAYFNDDFVKAKKLYNLSTAAKMINTIVAKMKAVDSSRRTDDQWTGVML